ncbi:MAG: GAF domain-containing protein [Planctomycetota bacterium]
MLSNERTGAETTGKHIDRPRARAGKALLVIPSRVTRDRVRAQLAAVDFECVSAARGNDAGRRADRGSFDLAVVELVGGDTSLVELVREASPALSIVAVADHLTAETAVDALRAGATDLVHRRTPGDELIDRARAAVDRTRGTASDAQRVVQLEQLCRELNSAREEVTNHVGSLCDDLVTAYQDMSGQIEQVHLRAEFNSLIRQQLDIEELLRTGLEYLLARLGAMNAAVYLPGAGGEHTLGAYVNYDCSRDSAEVMLDQFADTIAPRLEHLDRPLRLDSDAGIEAALGHDGSWFAGRSVAALTCRHDGETLAILLLFRDRATPFTDETVRVLDTSAELLAAQLARVIHVHHRHIPRDEWGLPGGPLDVDESDESDFEGLGFGGPGSGDPGFDDSGLDDHGFDGGDDGDDRADPLDDFGRAA